MFLKLSRNKKQIISNIAQHNLNIYFQNVNDIRSNLIHFTLSAATSSYSVIVLVKTNLYHEISNSELELHDLNVYICDRSAATSSKLCGGSVLVAVCNIVLSFLLNRHYRMSVHFLHCITQLCSWVSIHSSQRTLYHL